MPSYSPSEALRLIAPAATGARRATLGVGMTLLHVAAERASGPEAYAELAALGRVTDPIPFSDVPPRALRAASVWVGKQIALPEGGL